MELNEYQKEAKKTAIYPSPIIYPALGLCGEAGEVAEKVKKVLRDNKGLFTDEKLKEIAKELGDVLWYISNTASDIGFSLEEVAQGNIDKLKSRQQRDKISGSGDNR